MPAPDATAVTTDRATGQEKARRKRRARDGWMAGTDFALAPFTIAWEITRACALTGDIYASDPACAYQPSDNQTRRDEAP